MLKRVESMLIVANEELLIRCKCVFGVYQYKVMH